MMKKIAAILLGAFLLGGCAASRAGDLDIVSTLVAATWTAAAGQEAADAVVTQTLTPEPLSGTDAAPASDVELGAVYDDPELGYAFNYPATWKIAYGENQSRGGYFQFARADFQPDPSAGGLPAEEILLQATVYNWDPKGDLDAYLEHRYLAWEASGITYTETRRWTRPGGQPAVELLITGSEGDQALLILTVVGDRYLELSSDQEREVLSAIGSTLRDGE
jgi:hypothetical protein